MYKRQETFSEGIESIISGHYHKPHFVERDSRVRYVGSPYQISRAEKNQEKHLLFLNDKWRDESLTDADVLKRSKIDIGPRYFDIDETIGESIETIAGDLRANDIVRWTIPFDSSLSAMEEEEEEEEEMDPSEALARKLMEEEERLHRERMLAYAGVSLNTAETTQDHVMVEGEDIPPEDDDVADPDDMTYEELLQLGECVGRQATGMSGSQIKQFCTLKEFTRSGASGAKRKGGDEEEEEEEDCCSVCRCEFEEGEMMLELKCKHGFHEECLRPWLKEYKTCPLCKTDCM